MPSFLLGNQLETLCRYGPELSMAVVALTRVQRVEEPSERTSIARCCRRRCLVVASCTLRVYV